MEQTILWQDLADLVEGCLSRNSKGLYLGAAYVLYCVWQDGKRKHIADVLFDLLVEDGFPHFRQLVVAPGKLGGVFSHSCIVVGIVKQR